ncbi:hypothetical protein LWI29_030538 [Acer saccharum]|uniref:Uncharacterized protein n=1 Tax=Acer saccharum TaxID=4024 RepID=A0AA39W0V9_ACESA|nr:hypothetical protein LWI29_030538 [Acer saccharum]
MADDLNLPVEDKERKNGIIWEISSFNKFWKGIWFFIRGNWGRTVRADNLDVILSLPRHFCEAGRHSGKLSWTCTYCTSSEIVLPVAYNDPPDLSEDEKIRIAKAVQTKMETRRFASLVTEQKLQEYVRSIDPICGHLVKRARASKKNATPDGLGEVTAIDAPEGPRKRKRKVATVVASSRMGKVKAPRASLKSHPPEKTSGLFGFPSRWH